MYVVVDASDTMARLGEVAVWSFDLEAWGECAQASTETEALTRFARRAGVSLQDLETSERISGPDGIFSEDTLPATENQVSRTIRILEAQRRETLALLDASTDAELDAEDQTVAQPAWMPWRTPRTILRHIADTEARAYPRWCGLPQLEPVDDLREELSRSTQHIREVILEMPRSFRTTHRHETWTPVKLLRRLAYHERIELVFLRRSLQVR